MRARQSSQNLKKLVLVYSSEADQTSKRERGGTSDHVEKNVRDERIAIIKSGESDRLAL